ncbi:phage holin family protein [Pseudoclavibacter caeni]|jgi:uncharacterized membrane protein|uniref:Phage holin family protein n=1 Tax=Pseudoclavibacter caeni TaxID=908846 RepID=A0A7C8FXX8_9MICO|nr:phage holin family protein [Pseudoclavibacter caeni]KAB1633480.1 phage holin family protein [Pseudoclavibacter caeni]NYJ96529.1 putative membrane protein [Pseudoclavibacter caeni]
MTDRRPLTTLVGDISSDVQELVHEEIALAKAEVRQSARNAAVGGGLFIAAGLTAVLALFFLALAAWWGLGLLIGNALSGLVLAVVLLVIAGIAVGVGVRRVRRVKGAPRTVESVRGLARSFTPERSRR